MADSVSGGNRTPVQPPNKEMSMEMRLLLAFLLMGAVMFVTQLWFKPQEPAPAQKRTEPSASVPKPGEPPSPEVATPPPTTAEVAPPAPVAGATVQLPQPAMIVGTDLFRVVLNNQGGTIRSWQLKKYRGNDNQPLELVNTAAGVEFPFSLYFPTQKPATDVNWAWYKQTADADGLGVMYEFSDGHTSVVKSFKFEKSSYICRVTTSVATDGKPVPHLIEWRGGFGDLTVANAAANQRTLYFDLAEKTWTGSIGKLFELSAGSAKNGPVTHIGNYSFAGLADTYFAAVFLPQAGAEVQQVTFSDTVRTAVVEKPAPFAGVAISSGAENRFELFVGPKDVDLLTQINPKLTQVVDFGWLWFLAKPLFWGVNLFNDRLVHNFGWSIIVVTIIINFLLFPLKLTSMKSMRKMQALKPQIDEINSRYKNLKITDPRKGEQNQEVMALYKKYGVNPMGGCVPMLLQIPFFFAFYKVFTVSVEMRGASWLWVTDLSQPEIGLLQLLGIAEGTSMPIRILPIAMIASQFFMQKMTPQANADPNQQKMMQFMPIIFGFMFYSFPSGLVLYYLTSNLVGMGQQVFFNHTETAQKAARSVELPKKKNGRK